MGDVYPWGNADNSVKKVFCPYHKGNFESWKNKQILICKGAGDCYLLIIIYIGIVMKSMNILIFSKVGLFLVDNNPVVAEKLPI